MPRRLALGHAVPTGDADLPIKFHGIDLPALPARCRQDIGGRLLRRPKRDYPAATVVGFCTAALKRANHYIGAESSAALMRELNHAITVGSSERRLEMLRHVTEQFLTNASRLDQEHIELFDDVFVTLTKTIEAQALAQLSTSLASSGYTPKKTVQALAHHDEIAVSGPILSQSPALSDSDLVSIATTQNQEHLVAISQRATISEVVTDTLLKCGNTDVTHTLAKNSGARFSKAGFAVLVQRAKTDPNLAEPLSQRAD